MFRTNNHWEQTLTKQIHITLCYKDKLPQTGSLERKDCGYNNNNNKSKHTWLVRSVNWKVSVVTNKTCYEKEGLPVLGLGTWKQTLRWGFTVKSESGVAQLCPTLRDPMDCSLPGSSVHGIFQARILEWVAISFSRKSSRPRDWTQVSHIVGRCFTVWATREVLCIKMYFEDFPGGSAAKALHSQYRGPGFDPWSGKKIPHATTKSWHSKTKDSACHN